MPGRARLASAAVIAAAGAAAALVSSGAGAAGQPEEAAYRFAVALAREGPRPAGSAAERRAHARLARAFGAAGLRVARDGFTVPGIGRSRNVLGIHDAPGDCLVVVMAHADSVPAAPGADDNASGVGVLAALAPRLDRIAPPCDVWLAATGAEERPYTRRPDHEGALALVRRLRAHERTSDLRLALSLDEVGRGAELWLRSAPGRDREASILAAARGSGIRVRHVGQESAAAGMSDHRELDLAGLPAAKLGVPGDACRHRACDRAQRLDPATLRGTRRLVERLLASVP